jgi:hypothetical protein
VVVILQAADASSSEDKLLYELRSLLDVSPNSRLPLLSYLISQKQLES